MASMSATDGSSADADAVGLQGCSFIIKSRILQDGINFAQLEQEDKLPTSLRDCTVFLLPLSLPNEGTKMSKLRKLLTEEAICLDAAAGDRVWRLLVDASTVLTKLVQLGFSFSAASIHPTDNVYTWTVVGTDDEEEDSAPKASLKKRHDENFATLSIQGEQSNGTRMPLRNIVIYPRPRTQPLAFNNSNNAAAGQREMMINNRAGQPVGSMKLHAAAVQATSAVSDRKPPRERDVNPAARQLQSCSNIQIGRNKSSSDVKIIQPTSKRSLRSNAFNKTPVPTTMAENDDVTTERIDRRDDDADFGAAEVEHSIDDDEASFDSYTPDVSKKPSSKKVKLSDKPVETRATRATAAAKTVVSAKKSVSDVRPSESEAADELNSSERTTSPERRARLDASISAVVGQPPLDNASLSSKDEGQTHVSASKKKPAAKKTDDAENPFRIIQLGGGSKSLPKAPSEPLCETTTPSYISYKDDCIVLGEPPFERQIDFNVFNDLKEQYLFTLRHSNRLRDYARQVLHLAIPQNEAAIYEAPYNAANDAFADGGSGQYQRVPESFIIAIQNLVAEGWDEINKLCSSSIAKADDTSAVAPVQSVPPTVRTVRQMIEQYFQIAHKHPERQEKLIKDRRVWNQTMRQRRTEREREAEVRKQKVAETLSGQKSSVSDEPAPPKREIKRRVGQRQNLFAGNGDDLWGEEGEE